MEYITQIDIQILDFIREHLSAPLLDKVFPIFTALGNGGGIFLLLALLLLIMKPYRKVGINLAVAIAMNTLLVNLIIKPLVSRTRPYALGEGIKLLIAKPVDSSFPSGHTAIAFVVATVIFCYHKKDGALFFVVAAFMGFSRLYLYVHYPSDVLGGMLIGCLCGVVSVFLVKDKKFSIKKQSNQADSASS